MSIENNKNLVWSTIRVDKIDPEQNVYIVDKSAIVYFNQYDGLTIHLNLDQVDNLIDWAFSIKKAAAEKAVMADSNTTSSFYDL